MKNDITRREALALDASAAALAATGASAQTTSAIKAADVPAPRHRTSPGLLRDPTSPRKRVEVETYRI